jgi:PAS domain S-box-containing protein
VSYVGRDEIGDVGAAFRDLHVTAERLAGEIRATNAAISANRLDHRADVSAFEGTWAQPLAGMNDTTAAFAKLHRRRRRAERELEGIFNLSLALLCVAGQDGYFKRVNPAFERTLGYSSEELLAKPIFDFVHPDDRGGTREVHDGLAGGSEITQFENRYIRSDGVERWLQWSARSVPEEGLTIPPGTSYSLDGRSVSAAVWRTGRAVRLDSFDGPPGSVADVLRRLGIRSAAGAPILVENCLWGVMVAAWRQHQPASGLEDRITQFTGLVATAISNAQARSDLAASRARIITASDETRRRIERDLHDGAQQRLVSLGLGLRVAQRAVRPIRPSWGTSWLVWPMALPRCLKNSGCFPAASIRPSCRRAGSAPR